MKVFDLGCAQGHVFEGWFGSEEDFLRQLDGGLLDCPVCADRQISKRLSAPRLNLARAADASALSPENAQNSVAERVERAPEAQRQARWLQAMREHLARAEDVGDRFAQEARRMHHGDIPERAIRGQADMAQTVALWEEGIPVLPIPDSPALKHTLQ